MLIYYNIENNNYIPNMTAEKRSKEVSINISTSTILKVALISLALFFLWFVRDILAILFVSLILAALIDPLADWFERHRIPRAFSVILIYVVLLALLAVVLFLLIPPIVEQTAELAKDFGYYWSNVTAGVEFLQDFSQDLGISTSFEKGLESLSENISSAFGRVFGTVTGLLGGLAATLLVLVITFYMVVEEGSARAAYRSLAPEKYQPYISQLTKRMKEKIGHWLRGEIVLALIVGTLAFIALKILGVNHALVLAIAVGLAEFIPYLGPVLGAVPAIFVALAQSPIKAVLVILVFILIQQLENHLIYPKVMQRAVGLNPVISITALLIGAKLGGAIGAVLAIPVATVADVFIRDILESWSGNNNQNDAQV